MADEAIDPPGWLAISRSSFFGLIPGRNSAIYIDRRLRLQSLESSPSTVSCARGRGLHRISVEFSAVPGQRPAEDLRLLLAFFGQRPVVVGEIRVAPRHGVGMADQYRCSIDGVRVMGSGPANLSMVGSSSIVHPGSSYSQQSPAREPIRVGG